MRLLRMRFTVKRMMVAVAVVGTLLGVWAGLERPRDTLKRVAYSHKGRIIGLAIGRNPPWGVDLFSLSPGGRRITPEERCWDEWHLDCYRKYMLASQRPWMPVEPGPPSPE